MTSVPRAKGYAELREGAALVATWKRDELELRGADRLRFLNGLLTCDVRELAARQGRYGFLTSGKGRVLADVVVAALDERLVLDLPAGAAPEIETHLRHYRVADRVDIERARRGRRTVLAGPRAREVLEKILGPPPDAWGIRSGSGWRVASDLRLGVPAWRLLTSDPEGVEVARALAAAKIPVAESAACTAVRVEAGIPWFGTDFGPDNLPQETGLEDSTVSYEKGCYLGQEVVARVHYRGRPARRLRGFVAPGRQPLAVGAELFAGDDEVGVLTTVTWSPLLDRPIALGMLQRAAEDREQVTLADGTELAVVDLPFVPTPAPV